MIRLGPIAGARQHAAIRPDHHGAHRHFSPRARGAGLFQRDFHG